MSPSNAPENKLLFHGTVKSIFEDERQRFNGIFHPHQDICVYLDSPREAMNRAVETAYAFASDPLLLITASSLVKQKLFSGCNSLVIRGGLSSQECLLFDIPVSQKPSLSLYAFDWDESAWRLAETLRNQRVVPLPSGFDPSHILTGGYSP